jgi:Na+-translocating ferredoxin:NAD+ oxidoreductase RNF subunit RnfB
MNQTIIITIVSLSGLGAVAAMILYVVARQFRVETDPRIDEIEEVLPATNCGGCGQPGCRAFAEALTQAADISDMHCPVGGNDVMKQVGQILGVEVKEKDPYIAVVKCSGSFEHRKKTNVYDGAPNCTVASMLYGGDTGCAYGCLGLGECVDACDFDAMYMDEKTGLPVVIEDKCTACNACVKACPKDIMELWPRGRKNRRIFVACINEEKGGIAKKYCSVACTGCEKCVDVCRYDSVVVENNLAIIDPEKCKLCKDCVEVCPSKVIDMVNFPPKKDRPPREDRPDRKLARKKAERVGVEAGGAEISEAKARAVDGGGIETPVKDGKAEAAGTDTAEVKNTNTPVSESKTSNLKGQPSDKTEPNPVTNNTKKQDPDQEDKKDNSSEKENKA